MKYKEAVKQAMEDLAKDQKFIFLGYNVNYGSRGNGTLKDIPKDRCLETPLAENLMSSVAIGMSLEGFRPVVIIERHDFILNALDSIVNHADKFERLSKGQFRVPVIYRAIIGAKKPLDPGLQHTQDFTKAIREMVTFPVVELKSSRQILEEYEKAKHIDHPILFIERKDNYDDEC